MLYYFTSLGSGRAQQNSLTAEQNVQVQLICEYCERTPQDHVVSYPDHPHIYYHNSLYWPTVCKASKLLYIWFEREPGIHLNE